MNRIVYVYAANAANCGECSKLALISSSLGKQNGWTLSKQNYCVFLKTKQGLVFTAINMSGFAVDGGEQRDF